MFKRILIYDSYPRFHSASEALVSFPHAAKWLKQSLGGDERLEEMTEVEVVRALFEDVLFDDPIDHFVLVEQEGERIRVRVWKLTAIFQENDDEKD